MQQPYKEVSEYTPEDSFSSGFFLHIFKDLCLVGKYYRPQLAQVEVKALTVWPSSKYGFMSLSFVTYFHGHIVWEINFSLSQ